MRIYDFCNADGSITRAVLPAIKAAASITDEQGRQMTFLSADRREVFFLYYEPRAINEVCTAYGKAYDLV